MIDSKNKKIMNDYIKKKPVYHLDGISDAIKLDYVGFDGKETLDGFFSKEAYERKAEYAYRVSVESIIVIANNIAKTNNIQEDDINDLIEELEPIAELSHTRHTIHSTDRFHFLYGNNVSRLLNAVENEYYEGELVYVVNGINKKYKLVDSDVEYLKIPIMDLDIDSCNDIIEYYGEEVSEDEFENKDLAVNLLYEDWDNKINNWSNSVRVWFGKLNKKFGSKFPSSLSGINCNIINEETSNNWNINDKKRKLGSINQEAIAQIEKEIRLAQEIAKKPKGTVPSYIRTNMNGRVSGKLDTLWKNRDYETFNLALDKIKEAGVIYTKVNAIWERHKNTPDEELYKSKEFEFLLSLLDNFKEKYEKLGEKDLRWSFDYYLNKLSNEYRIRSLNVIVTRLKEKQEQTGIVLFDENSWVWKYLHTNEEEVVNKENPESGVLYEADGCRVEDNVELSRVQIFFPCKPSYDVLSYLKSNGFHWSPSNKAWQRQNTQEGRRQAIVFAKKFFPDELKKEVSNDDTEIETIDSILESGKTTLNEKQRKLLLSYSGNGGSKTSDERGILDEYYTPDYVCEFMYQLAVKYGYKKGKILEPSCAIGNIIRPFYERNDYNHIDAFEINDKSRKICKLLYPNVKVYENYFETAFLEQPRFSTKIKKGTWLSNAPYDLVIGNPPYGKHTNKFSTYFNGNDRFEQIEMFFMYKGLDLLRSGGLLIYITSTNFLSTGNKYLSAKERIGSIADFIDAYRLPKVFSGTDISTDIIVLRKK